MTTTLIAPPAIETSSPAPARIRRPPVHELFQLRAEERPTATALVESLAEGERITTYGELLADSRRLANTLLAAGLEPEAPVVILSRRSSEVVRSILGVLQAGGVFVPVDPATPERRLVNLLGRVRPALAVVDSDLIPDFKSALGQTGQECWTICTDGCEVPGSLKLVEDTLDPGIERDPNGQAYIYFTSGSTGEPKGIVGRLRGIDHYVCWQIDTFGLGPEDRGAQLGSPAFDAFLRETLVPLCAGAAVHIPPSRETVMDAAALVEWLDEQRITFFFCVPTVLRTVLGQESSPEHFAELRHVFLAGERLLPADVAGWHGIFGDRVQMVNLYGPTETTLTKLFYAVRQGDGEAASIPIGEPMRGAEVMVLDRSRQPCPPGTVGEIYLRTPFRSHGYLEDPERTAQVFWLNPWNDDPNDLLYRTGDYGRQRPDGLLEFLGRRDQQVKLRGVRVELGEVEEALRRRDGIEDVVVAVRVNEQKEQQLCAWWVGEESLDEVALRSHCGQHLPAALVPTAFLRLDDLPRTITGKVDRKSLPDPWTANRERTAYVAPRNELEEQLAAIWSEVLGVPKIGVDDSFFALGGHSLPAIRALSRVRAEFGVEVPLAELFQNPTLGGLASVVEKRSDNGERADSRIIRIPRDVEIPQTSAQRRLWFLQQLDPRSTAYSQSVAVRMVGPLRIPSLQAALDAVIERHEALRTTFQEVDGRPVQVVGEPWSVKLQQVDLSDLDSLKSLERFAEIAHDELSLPFNLAEGPLLRFVLARFGKENHGLLLVTHHIVSDEQSLRLLFDEVATLYDDPRAELPELAVQFRDYAHWQKRQQADGSGLEAWVERLSGAPDLLEMPTDHPRPAVQTYRGARRPFALEPELSQAFLDLGERHGATPFMTLLAAFQVLLARWSGQRDVSVGAPSGGRRHVETEGLIGFFVNTLVLRTQLEGHRTFGEVLEAVRETVLHAESHQDVPFEDLVEVLRSERELGWSPLFQVWFVLHNATSAPRQLRDLEMQPLGLDNPTAKFDITLMLSSADDGVAGELEYNADLFDAATADRMLGGLRQLIAGIVRQPEVPVWHQPLMAVEERGALLEFTDRVDPGATLSGRFAQHAASNPGAIAVVHQLDQLTYGQLAARANRLAWRLRELGVGPEKKVGLFLERSTDLVTAILAVLEAGGAYVPLDPIYPEDRVRFVLADAGVEYLLTSADLAESLGEAPCPVEHLENLLAQGGTDEEARKGPGGAHPDNLAYVIYTSGSTGRPKGVEVSHSNVSRLLDAASDHFTFTDQDVWTFFHSYAFDFSVWELWGALAFGGQLVVVPREVAQSAEEFWRLLLTEQVTVLNQTPTVFRQVMEAALADTGMRRMALREVIFGGEALEPASLAPWFERFGTTEEGGPRMVNMYGITETTVHVTFREIGLAETRGAARSVVGEPLANLRIVLTDREGEPVPVGVAGEIRVGGTGLARGYLGRPALTAQRFVPDAFSGLSGERLYRSGDLARRTVDGELEYLGRIDHQVKIRGFRIELGEIAAALEAQAGISRAVVVLDGEGADRRLVAYAVPAEDTLPPTAALRAQLGRTLPDYMVPAVVVELAEIPRTAHGKLDRRALPDPSEARAAAEGETIAPRNATEEMVVAQWRELLGVETVGVEDNFFELGGHSLLATRLRNRLRERLGAELTLLEIFEHPTPAGQALRVEEARGRRAETVAPIETVPRDGEPLPASFGQERLWTLQQLDPSGSAYNMPVLLWVDGELNLDALGSAVRTVVARHEVLRTTFEERDGRAYQRIAEAPRELRPTLRDLVAAEESSAAALEEAVAEARRPFDLSAGPLYRLAVWRVEPQRHLVLWAVHHALFDGVSTELFVSQLGELYAASARGERLNSSPAAVQYADWSVWQRKTFDGPRGAEVTSWWKDRLAGLEPLEVAPDHPRPAVRGTRGGTVRRDLEADLADRLRAAGQAAGGTLFMTLLAGFKALLARVSGSHDVAVGSPAAGRGAPGSDELLGFFVNTLVLRTNLSGAPSFEELVGRIRKTTLGATQHQDMPFEHLVSELTPVRGARPQLFRVLFDLVNQPQESLEVEGLTFRPVDFELGAPKFDLTLTALERTEGLRLTLEYDRDLYDEATVDSLLDALVRLYTAAADDPSRPVLSLPLAETHDAVLERPAPTNDLLFPERFAAAAAAQPEAIALRRGEEVLTYEALAADVRQLASVLRHRGVGPETVVAVACDRRFELVTAVLAVLEAGGAYLPIDPAWPAERIGHLLADGGAALLLTRDELLTALGEDLPPVLRIETASEEEGSDTPAEPVTSEHLAYVLFTSGSTGRPKGTLVHHGGLASYLDRSAELYGLEPGQPGALLHASIGFDMAVTSLLLPLAVGASVTLVPEEDGPDALVEHLARGERHALLKLTPSHLEALSALLPDSLTDVADVLVLGGEALRFDQLEAWQERCPGQRVVNEYGPTETVVGCSVHDFRTSDDVPGRAAVPIGEPLPGTRLAVVDASLRPLPAGSVGELLIGGVAVARGYRGRAALTAERFVPDPFATEAGARLYKSGDLVRVAGDGQLVYLGRRDHQVKIRGHRVEPGEIEAALLAHEAVAEAAVIARRDGHHHERLVAYWVPSSEDVELAPKDLRAALEERLPEYMVPAFFVRLDALPLAASGKLDRRALPAPVVSGGGGGRAPGSPAEESLLAIWQQVLRLDDISVEDDFLELGGDSILALQVVAAARTAGLGLKPRQLFEHPTVAELARVAETIDPQAAVDEGPAEGEAQLLPIQQDFLTAEQPDADHYNQAIFLACRRSFGAADLERAVTQVVEHHDALRFVYRHGAEGWSQTYDEGRKNHFTAIDLSGAPDPERALESTAAALQAGFDLAEGPLFRTVLFELGDGRAQHLLLLAHHLLVDGVSWRVLLDDLASALDAVEAGRIPELPAKTASFQRWAEHLEGIAQSGELDGELEHWAGEGWDRVRPLPRLEGSEDSENRVSQTAGVVHELESEATRQLLEDVPAALAARVEEVLLTAAGHALAELTESSRVRLDLEGHGREELAGAPDVSRTVGWFTAVYPVLLEVEPESTTGSLRRVKDDLREIPSRGMGHGLLRRLRGDHEIARRLDEVPASEVSFNYLGRLDRVLAEESPFVPSQVSPGPLRSSRQRRSYGVEIAAGIEDGRLRTHIAYGRELYSRQTLITFRELYDAALHQLIDHCWTEGSEEAYAPSDFPEADLSADQLDNILAEIDLG